MSEDCRTCDGVDPCPKGHKACWKRGPTYTGPLQTSLTVGEGSPNGIAAVKEGDKVYLVNNPNHVPYVGATPPPPIEPFGVNLSFKGKRDDAFSKAFKEGSVRIPEQKKNIEWATASVNPITGCMGPGGERCSFCYAWRVAERFKGRNGFPADDPFKPTWHPSRLGEIYSRRKPRVWFIGSMCDWLDDGVHPSWRSSCLSAMWHNPRHLFVTLTKQYWNLSKILEDAPQGPRGLGLQHTRGVCLPPNLIVGISVTSREQVKGLSTLIDFPGVKKAVSFEPLLEDVADEMGYGERDALRFDTMGQFVPTNMHLKGIDWAFIGGCSRQRPIGNLPAVPAFIPLYDWTMRLWSLAKASGCKVFVKPNANFILLAKGGKRVNTQEYPEIVSRVLNGLPAVDRCPECGEVEPYVPDKKTGLPARQCYKCGWPEVD